MYCIKKVDDRDLFIKQHELDIQIWDISHSGQPIQTLEFSDKILAIAWSNTSVHFIVVFSHSIRTFGLELNDNRIQLWKEVSCISFHAYENALCVQFSYPLFFIKSERESYLINTVNGEKRLTSDVMSAKSKLFNNLSRSGIFLLTEETQTTTIPDSLYSSKESGTFSIASLVPLICAESITDIADLSDLKKTYLDLRKVTSAQPKSFVWHSRAYSTNYELLSVIYDDLTVAIFSVTHERIMEDDGIMAIALNAVLTARSMNNTDNDLSYSRIREEERNKISATSLIPSAKLVTTIDGQRCLRMFISPSESLFIPESKSLKDITITSQWLEASIDPASMIEEDNDTNPIISSSAKLALPPIVRKTKRVDLSHQGSWLALLCASCSDVKIITIRLGYEVQTTSFAFDFEHQVRARISFAHNSNLSIDWNSRSCFLQGHFSANFRQLLSMQIISVNRFYQSIETDDSDAAAFDVVQLLFLRNRAGEFRKAMETNYLLDSSSVDESSRLSSYKVGFVRHLPNSSRDGKLIRLSSVAALGLQQNGGLPKLYLLPIANCTNHFAEKKLETGIIGNPTYPNLRYVLDENDFVLCGFDENLSTIDVYIRDPAYLSGASQLSPRPKASTSSLEEIHRGRYGSNPNIYFVDIIPDEQYGLGLRLDEEKDPISGHIKVIINSFKPHPITNEPMAAELTSKITIGDEIIGANTASFVNKSQSYVIQTMKSMLATNHGNILRLVMKRSGDKSSSFILAGECQQVHTDGGESDNTFHMRGYDQEWKSASLVQTLSLHPLKAHVQLDMTSTCTRIVDVNTVVVMDEIGQHEVTVFVLAYTAVDTKEPRSTPKDQFDLHVFQLRYQSSTSHYSVYRSAHAYSLTTIKSFGEHPRLQKITMVTHLLHALDSKALAFSITIYHPPPLSLSAHTALLQTTIDGQVQRLSIDEQLELVNMVELCQSPIQHFLQTFRIDQSVYSRCLEQYARMHGQELRRQAKEDAETDFDLTSTTSTSSAAAVASSIVGHSETEEINSLEMMRRRKEWSFLDAPVSVDVFLSTSRFFTMAREINQTLEESLVNILSTLMQLQGHKVLYNVEAADRQWTERNSTDAAQILTILQKRNYIGRFQEYVRSKLKPYVDFRAKEFVREYTKLRNEMFSTSSWQYQCENSPRMYLGEQQATCSALFVIDHLAEVMKFASRVYLYGNNNIGFVKYLNGTEKLQNPRDDWRLLSTLLVQGQAYVQLDGFGMNSILYAMTKRGYTSVFLHVARKLEAYNPDIFLRGRKKKAMEVIDDGEDDYKRTLTSLSVDLNNISSGNTSASATEGSFSIGGSTLYEAKKQQQEFESLRQAQSQFIPMYVSMTSVINALFSKSQDALFVIFVDNFNVLGREDDTSRLQMWLELGKDVSYTPVSNDIPMDATPVPVWQHVDLLTYAARMKVSLWLHDLEPLVQLILRHALKQFKANKAAMEVFLDLIIIGKTETLLQLARTDTSPSGKQLISLLLLVDEAFNPASAEAYRQKQDKDSDSDEDSESDEETLNEATRIANLLQKLRKNADALIRKKRYREAAAVLLLVPTGPMVKAALNLLTFQFNSPFLAHLVARCIEYRVYCHAELSQQKLERYCIREMMRSNQEALKSRLGYVHGIYSTQLIEKDMLPDLWRTMDVAKRSAQASAANTFSVVQEQERRNSAYYHLEGIPCLQTTLVVALWTQKLPLIQETFHKVMDLLEENLMFHPENIGDFARKIILPSNGSKSSTNFPGSASSAHTAGDAGRNNLTGGMWTGKLGIPPMLMHEIHVGLTKSCIHDFSADDILIIQNFLRGTYGQDIYRVYGFVEIFLSLQVFESYAQIAGQECTRRFASFRTKLYTALGMGEEALQFQAAFHVSTPSSTTETKRAAVNKNAFIIFCERFRQQMPSNFHRAYDTLCSEASLAKQQARASALQREQELNQRSILSKQQQQQQEQQSISSESSTSETSSANKMSFNFAASKTSTAATPIPSGPKNMLDAFDMPVSRPSKAAAAAAAAAASTVRSAQKQSVRNMLDDFDAPPPAKRTSAAAAAAAAAAVGAVESSNKSAAVAAAPPPSALDVFDPPTRASSSRPVKAPAAVVDPFAATSGTALDLFDFAPAPRRSQQQRTTVAPAPATTSPTNTAISTTESVGSSTTTTSSISNSITSSTAPPLPAVTSAPAVKSALDFDAPVSRPTRPRPSASNTSAAAVAAAAAPTSSPTDPGMANPPSTQTSSSATSTVTINTTTSANPSNGSISTQPVSSVSQSQSESSGSQPHSSSKRDHPPQNPFLSTPTRPVNTNTAPSASSHTKQQTTPNLLSPSRHASTSIEERVRDFYRQHNPAKLSSVPEILEKYRGREQELLQKLQKQYGVSTPLK